MDVRQHRQELEQELLAAVEEAEQELQRCNGAAKGEAQMKYQQALKRFNDFVIHGKIPEG